MNGASHSQDRVARKSLEIYKFEMQDTRHVHNYSGLELLKDTLGAIPTRFEAYRTMFTIILMSLRNVDTI
jgi:hypothetical protein